MPADLRRHACSMIRFRDSEMADVYTAARAEGLTMAEWVRDVAVGRARGREQ